MDKLKNKTVVSKLLTDGKDLLEGVQAFKESDPTIHQSLNMSLKSVCNELNKLEIRQITGEKEDANGTS